MEEDPLIPLVHAWSNAAFDHASAAFDPSPGPRARCVREGEKENHRPSGLDVDAEIGHIEAEILRLSSRLHHLRTAAAAAHPEPNRGCEDEAPPVRAAKAAAARPRARGLSLGPLDVIALPEKQPPRAPQNPRPARLAPPQQRGRGLSLGPLDIAAAANPRVPAAALQSRPQGEGGARPILNPIKEPPVQRRRGVSLGPLEIHHSVIGKPPAARVKPFPGKLSSVREEGQRPKQHAVPAKPWPSSNARQGTAASRAKARSGSMSPRSRRQSTAKATETRASNASSTETRGGNAAAGAHKVVEEHKPNGAVSHAGNAAIGRRPAGSSKVRVVPSRYSLTPGSSLGAGAQEKRQKQSLPGSASGASQKEEIRAKLTEPSSDELSPETIARVAELLPRIRTMPPSDESPRDSGCAKRVADLVGKRSFFMAAADDGDIVTPFQARVLDVESPEAAAGEEA